MIWGDDKTRRSKTGLFLALKVVRKLVFFWRSKSGAWGVTYARAVKKELE